MSYKLNWIPSLRHESCKASLFDDAIVVQIMPAYTSGQELYGKFEICIGMCYFSRDRRSMKGDDRFYFDNIEQAKETAENIVEKMLRKALTLWD